MGPRPAKCRWKYVNLVLCVLLCTGTVSAQLNADFSMDVAGGCSPLVVNFTNRTSGASSNAMYLWSFGNGNSSALANAAAVYTEEQTYTVTLTVKDGASQSTRTQQVTVYKPPVVDFGVNPAKICLGSPVTFSASASPGSGTIGGYTWDYGDGTTQQEFTGVPQHVYGYEQVATVSLTVVNSYGCHTTKTKPNLVRIIPALTAGFTADKKVLCLVTDPVQFTNTSKGPGTLDYLWDFGDGNSSTQTSPNYTFNKKGNYQVKLTVHSSEGCTAVATQSNPLNVANYQTIMGIPSPICKGVYVNFTDQSTPGPDASVWEVDGVPQYYSYGGMSYAFNVVGDHTVALKNTYGTCPMAKTVTVSVKDLPYPTGFTSTVMGKCGAPVAVNFQDPTAGAVKWEWDFNYQYYYNPVVRATTQAPSYTYTADGTYQVWLRMTNADGCSNSIVQNVTISRPTVNIIVGPGTLSSCSSLLTYTFGTSASEGLTATKWSFGDGSSSTDPNPTHTFKNTGSYTVSCSYTTVNGCTGTASVTVYPLSTPPPVTVSTSPSPPVSCAKPITVSFFTYTSDPLLSTKWDLGDGSSSTDPAPVHTYNNIGYYNAVLTYTTQAGCKGTVTAPTVVIDPKITGLDFSITPNPVCGNNTVSFKTTPNLYDINSFNWDFGDGNYNYSSSSLTYSYNNAGTYTVKLYARNLGGCDTTMSKTITVNPPFPKISGYSNTCDGTRGEVSFTQTSVQATSITWNFGDGTTATVPGNQAVTKHTYTKTGTYTVSITATNGQCTLGYTYPYPVYVLLKQSPVMTSAQSAVCSNTPVDIQVSGLDRNPYQTNDQYTYPYYAGYTFTGAQYGDGSAFQGNRTDAGYYYRWTTTYNATMSNFKTGEKGLRLIMQSYVFGCADTTNVMPLAIRGVWGGFKVVSDKQCYQSPVVLQDTSTSTADNKIVSWQWNFGDGVTQKNTRGGTVTHAYANPGNYTASLQITDAAGCSSNTPFTQPVQVNGPMASFYSSGTDVHLNTTVYFSNTTNDYGNSNTVYTWNFGDGASSNDVNPAHTYTVPGTYTVTMTASNPTLPCSSTATPVVIIVRNFNSHFAFNSSYIIGSCPPMLVSFANTSYGYVAVSWDFGDGFTAGNVNYPSHIYAQAGKYIVTLSVYGYNGLTGQFIDSVIIRDPVLTMAPAPAESCIGTVIKLSSSADYAGSYSWDFGDGSIVSTADGNAAHKYLTAGVYTATLLVKNDAGCLKDSVLQQPVRIRPNPDATVSPSNPFICAGSSLQLQAAAGSSVYQWTPSTGLNSGAVSNPVASPSVTTDYLLTVTDDIGCQNTAPVTVAVQQHLVLKVSPDDTVCAGEISKLIASGEDHYQWINNTTGLSDTDIPNPIALAPETMTYTVKGWDNNHCFTDEADVTVTVRPLPTVTAGPDLLVEAGYDAVIYASGSDDVVSWAWLPEKYLSCYHCASPLCTPLATTAYFVTVKNQYGCKASDTVVVAVDCQESHVRIPNAFTPNGNGSNDVFMIKGISIVKHMAIYNRWGEKVFERDNFIAGDRSSCWDGNYRGEKCLPGTYVYFVEMECPAGGTFSRKGSFILIR